MELSEIKTTPKRGDEKFLLRNQELNFNITDFWAWNQSDLIENRNRGILAEFLVRQALGLRCPTRLEWDEADLRTEENLKIEVKSAAYIQSWKKKKFSSISFDISPKHKLQSDNNYSVEKIRVAHIYIFCLLAHKDQATLNPMELEQWQFYLLPAKILNEKLPHQKLVGLNTLVALGALACSYGELSAALDEIRKQYFKG
jgi:hypothetical protein